MGMIIADWLWPSFQEYGTGGRLEFAAGPDARSAAKTARHSPIWQFGRPKPPASPIHGHGVGPGLRQPLVQQSAT
ncbi:hypothetical protein [Agrobacterium rosae]|uniref:hypothetical protein n=1 Tax=Agrobacterium rosae TaxID=1972867 RepID=UPI0019D3CF84|nr:hypothetical protein [Agrobacterium rosae]